MKERSCYEGHIHVFSYAPGGSCLMVVLFCLSCIRGYEVMASVDVDDDLGVLVLLELVYDFVIGFGQHFT